MSDSPKSPVERREEGVPEWRIALADAVDGTVAHLSLMMLLIIDIIIIAMEFMLRGTACGDGSNSGGLSDAQVDVGDWLHGFSVGILVVFAVHLFVQMIALQGEFFGTPHYLLDTFIIVTALVFELANFREGDLITILLLSRLVRVAHSVAHTIHMQNEEVKHKVESAVTEQESPFENEKPSPQFVDAFAAERKLAVERIADGDGEFTAGLQVPLDLAAIDDVATLRLLVAEERKLREYIQGE